MSLEHLRLWQTSSVFHKMLQLPGKTKVVGRDKVPSITPRLRTTYQTSYQRIIWEVPNGWYRQIIWEVSNHVQGQNAMYMEGQRLKIIIYTN